MLQLQGWGGGYVAHSWRPPNTNCKHIIGDFFFSRSGRFFYLSIQTLRQRLVSALGGSGGSRGSSGSSVMSDQAVGGGWRKTRSIIAWFPVHSLGCDIVLKNVIHCVFHVHAFIFSFLLMIKNSSCYDDYDGNHNDNDDNLFSYKVSRFGTKMLNH